MKTEPALREYRKALAIRLKEPRLNEFGVGILRDNIGYCLLLLEKHEEGIREILEAQVHNRTRQQEAYVREYFAANYNGVLHYKVPKANPGIRDRISLTNAKLRTASGDIQLVSRNCAELVKDFEQVCYKADSTVPDKDKDRRRTHLSDALGYLLWQECRLLQPIGERNQPLL